MNTKLLATTLGALLLSGSTLVLAGDRDNRHHGGPGFHAPQHNNWSRGDRHWEAYRGHRWSAPPPRVYWRPAPVWHPRPHAYGGYGHGGNGWNPGGYNRDGVTIILRGRIN